MSLVLFLTLISWGHAQCNELRELINSDFPLNVKTNRIKLFIDSLNGRKNFKIADCYHDLGYRWYYKNWLETHFEKDIEMAIKYTSLSVKIKKNNQRLDTISLRQSLYNLGHFQKSRGNFFKSVRTYRDILALSVKDDFEYYTKNDLGLLLTELGEFEEAQQHFKDAVTFSRDRDNLWELLIFSYINVTDCYASMGYFENQDSITKYVRLAKDIVNKKGLKAGFEDQQLKILEGNLLLRTGEYFKAIEVYNSIIETNFEDKQIPQIVHNNLGFCQLKAGDTKNAKINLSKAIELDSTYSDPYENMGDLYLEQKEFKIGMSYYQRAIDLALEKTMPTAITILPGEAELALSRNKLPLLNHLITKAIGWLRYFEHIENRKYLQKALTTFKKADQLIDIIKRENTEFQSKLYWRDQGAKLYANAVEVCHYLKHPYEAYYFMERNKALLLLEDLTNEEAKEIAQIPTEKAQQEFDLKRAIFLLENKLQENIGIIKKDSLAILKQIVRNHKYNYEKFIDSLEKTYPDYAKFKKKVDVLSFKDLKSNHITESKAMLHYILNEEDGYGLLTTTDTTVLFRLDSVANLNKNVEQLITALSNGVSDINNFQKISNTVFQQLFPQDVYEKIRGKQLIIVPDYTLQQIPFESLVVDSTALKYLFQEVEIGYAYSASLLDHNQKERAATDIDFLGIAPIAFDSLQLPELYFSENEIENIAGLYFGETLLNGEASKSNFIENADNHNILHLATHADVGDGDNPWIAFSDSKMYLKEIYATKNRADMVVLSGCNTSNGKLKRGEGVMSLARGFFYSGAKSVVSTLWPVADESGKDILINFYKNLNEGHTKSKALQKAKLDYLKNTEEEELKHPYYWAGFVVLGDTSPISDKPISSWLLAGLGLLGTGILVFGYKKIKARRAAA